jgi:hypothetical protein
LNFKRLYSNAAVIWTFRICITLLFVVITFRSFSKEQALELVRSVRFLPVFLAVLLGAASFLCHIFRWMIILKCHQLPSTLKIASKTMFFGALLAFITPGRAGELFRGISVGETRKADSIIAVIIDKAYILISVFTIGVICALSQKLFLKIELPAGAKIVSFSAQLITLGLTSSLSVAGRFRKYTGGFAGFLLKIISCGPGFFSVSGINSIILAFAAQILCVVQTVALIRMFADISWASGISAVGQACSFMAFVPFTIANIGIREYSFGMFLGNVAGQTEYAASAAIGASTGILLINLVLPALVGLIWNYLPGSGRKSLSMDKL